VAALAAATLISYLTVPVYSATATVRVAQAQGGTVQYGDFMYADRLINTYVRMAASSSVLEEVIQKLELPITSDQLARRIQVKPVADTELITVTAEDGDPNQAKAIAGALSTIISQSGSDQLYVGGSKSAADIVGEQLQSIAGQLASLRAQQTAGTDLDVSRDLQQQIAALEQSYATSLRQYDDLRTTEALRANSVSVVEPPTLPASATRPNWPVNLAVAAVLGLVVGSGLGYVLEDSDRRVHDVRQISQELGLPLLGTIPRVSTHTPADRLVTVNPTVQTVAAAEAYRFIQMSLGALPQGAIHSLIVTSAEAGEGKSSVSANLSVALARAGSRVLLVDADFLRPSIHQIFCLANMRGFGDLIAGHAQPAEVLKDTTEPNLRVVTSGSQPWRPGGALGSAQMQRALDALSVMADVIVIDTPPLLSVADTTQLASMVEHVVLVVGEEAVRTDRVRDAAEHLRAIQHDPLGVVGILRVPASKHPYARYARNTVRATEGTV
jgi:capsular exopolysaccharide synthesis family protein